MSRSLSKCITLIVVGLTCGHSPAANDPSKCRQFDLGGSRSLPGWTPVKPSDAYSAERGFGFEPGSSCFSVDANGDPILSDAVISDLGTCFSIRLPEGIYRVVATVGHPTLAATTTIKSEARRLMLESVQTAAGTTKRCEFYVHIRTPTLREGKPVAIAANETQSWLWDDKLTIEWLGSKASLAGLEITPAPNAPVLWLLGDSTVADQEFEPWNSWGQMIPRFLQPGIAVANMARSGASISSAQSSRRVQKMLEHLKSGDFVCIQFGHNDMKDRSPNALENYRSRITQLTKEIHNRGAQAILVTSMERKAGINKPTLGQYPQTIRDIARDCNLPCIDLNTMSLTLYRALNSQIDSAFVDGSHHNPYGSYLLARCVTLGIRNHVPSLARWLTHDAFPFDPAKPRATTNFTVPPSPRVDPTKPEGY